MRSIALVLIILLVPLAGSLTGSVPRSEKEVPIFKGATRDQNVEKERLGEQGEDSLGMFGGRLKSHTLKVYRSTAVIDEVFAFYRTALDAREGSGEEDPMALAPGMSLPAYFNVYFHGEDRFEDQDDDHGIIIYPGKAMKSAFQRDGRKPFREGQYLAEAQFYWAVREVKGGFLGFTVIVLDDSTREVEDAKTGKVSWRYERGTLIEIRVETYAPGRL